MSITRKNRIAELVRRIPKNYERKDAAPNPVEALKAQLLESITGKLTAYREEVDKQLAEIKTAGVTNPEAEKQVALLIKRIDGLDAELRRPEGRLPEALQGPTIGERFAKSDAVKDMSGRWRRGGMSVKFEDEFNPFFGHETKTTITSGAVGSSTPGILVPQRLPGIVPLADRALRIRDLLPVRSTKHNAVEYIQELAFTNAASPQGTEGDAKAESALTFTIASDPVRTLAHWIPASRQILDDMEGLRDYIDRRLMYGLKLIEDQEILNGNNTGQHLNGLVPRATAYAATYVQSADTRIDTVRHAKLELEVRNEVATGLVLNPVDWERIELVKDEAGGANTGRYIIGVPGAGISVPTLWNMPVVTSNSMNVGKFLLGNFAQQAMLFDRMQAVLDLSTEHSDYFVKNLVALRAEERLVLAVFRPAAFVYGSFS